MDFGLTNDKAQFDAANAWRIAAIADGWAVEASYGSEPIESSCKLKRDGFVVHVLSRDQGVGKKWKYQAKVDGWAPDELVIRLPTVYSGFEVIQKQMRHCNKCESDDVDTQRYSFAGRCCANCIGEARRVHERPGWTM